jgi:hypothetical protein
MHPQPILRRTVCSAFSSFLSLSLGSSHCDAITARMQVLVISLQTPQTPREHPWIKFQFYLNLKNQFAEGVIER